jgi:phosphatidylserine decarboxylase
MSALTYATAQLLRVLPRARVTRAIGRWADHAWSPPVGKAVVALYSRLYDVELHECEARSWDNFDSFFTRELRHGARPIDDDPRAIVSPADGRIESMGRIEQGATFLVKGRPYRVDELVGDSAEAERYAGGTCAVIYLSPRDYHRVHAPVGGYVRRIRSMPGDYYPVNAIGIRHVPNLFVRNRRVAISIDTPDSGGMGRVTVVMVAAMVVGRITAVGIDARDVPFGDHFFDPPRPVQRGDEIGVFHLGSTAVLLLEDGAVGPWVVEEGAVRFGQRLASGFHAAPSRAASVDHRGAG